MTQVKHPPRQWFAFIGAWLVGSIGLCEVRSSDWAQYRGPNHDGSSSEILRTNWNVQPPKVVWKKAIEPGWSSVTISGGRVFTQVNRPILGSEREVCVALNADTGAELWAANLDLADYPDAGTGTNDGPRSTPSVDGDRVYILTSYLRLYCLRADTGAVVWMRNFLTEFPGTSVIAWQNAASPLVVGDLIFLNSNVANERLMAVRKSDGKTVWKGQNDTMTHATPAYATIAGTPQVLFLTSRGLVGMTPESGSVLWRYSFSPSGTSTAATPIAANDYVYASCAYSLGAWTARVSRNGDLFSVGQTDYKRNNAYQNHWATPVHHDGHLYGIVENGLRSFTCFSLKGRTNRWITQSVGGANPGYASLIKVGGKLLVLTERGRLVLVEPNPEAYTEIANYQALRGHAWNHPAFSNGRIYARTSAEIVALDVAAALPPLPLLTLAATLLPSSLQLRLEVSAPDGTQLDTSTVERIELLASPAMRETPNWTLLNATFTPTGGKLLTDLPLPADEAAQYLRVRERPPLP